MAVQRTCIGTTHVIAECRTCNKVWQNWRTAVDLARRHANETGHVVHVERAQVWTYNDKALRRA